MEEMENETPNTDTPPPPATPPRDQAVHHCWLCSVVGGRRVDARNGTARYDTGHGHQRCVGVDMKNSSFKASWTPTYFGVSLAVGATSDSPDPPTDPPPGGTPMAATAANNNHFLLARAA